MNYELDKYTNLKFSVVQVITVFKQELIGRSKTGFNTILNNGGSSRRTR